jgi:hypothetical protein
MPIRVFETSPEDEGARPKRAMELLVTRQALERNGGLGNGNNLSVGVDRAEKKRPHRESETCRVGRT